MCRVWVKGDSPDGNPVLSVREGEVWSPMLTHCGLNMWKSIIQLHSVLLIYCILFVDELGGADCVEGRTEDD